MIPVVIIRRAEVRHQFRTHGLLICALLSATRIGPGVCGSTSYRGSGLALPLEIVIAGSPRLLKKTDLFWHIYDKKVC